MALPQHTYSHIEMVDGTTEWHFPELESYDSYKTIEGWREMLKSEGHVWFFVEGRYYFLFPEAKDGYGLCYGEDELTGNFARWTFRSADEFFSAKLFNGKSIFECLPAVYGWQP